MLPPRGVGSGQVALRVQRAGVDTRDPASGELVAWQQDVSGGWWAEVRVQLRNPIARGQHTSTLFAPAQAVRPRSEEG